jgi:hypothetical protein
MKQIRVPAAPLHSEDSGGPPFGIYEALLDGDLKSLLERHPELRSVFGKIAPEEEPSRYASFLTR